MSILTRMKNYFADTPSGWVRKDLTHAPADIPPCAVMCCRSKGFIGYVIRRVTKAWTNHIAIYVGSGRQAIIEALPDGMVEKTLSSKLTPKDQFLIFVKPDLTVAEAQIIKAYLYGTLGKPYGWKEIVRFLGGIFKKIKPDNGSNFCSENAVEAFAQAGIRISKNNASDTSPDDVVNYFLSMEGRAAGWTLFDTYNC